MTVFENAFKTALIQLQKSCKDKSEKLKCKFNILIKCFRAVSAVHAAYHIGAAAIVCVTTTGKTVQFISKYRPQCPTVAVTRYCLLFLIPVQDYVLYDVDLNDDKINLLWQIEI